jgi:regulator of cell morphogenesis and NO signaling
MLIQEDQIIGELVAKDYRTASIFKKYGIDFCCQGNRTIHDACVKKNIESAQVLADLNQQVQAQEENKTDFQSWPLDLLADYIEKKHHRYVEQQAGEILPYLEKICRVHGAAHPELAMIREHFTACAGELAVHMKKEELVVFPFVRKMMKAKHDKTGIGESHFGTIQNPIRVMMDDHSTEGERFRKIAELSNSYTPPQDACNTYRVTFALLKEFEDDLHLHIHLENNILFPGAIVLEKTFLERA